MIKLGSTVFLLVSFLIIGCRKAPRLIGGQAEAESQSLIDISGRIELDPSLKDKVADKDTVFLIARPAAGGPPLAAIKFLGKSYPYVFSLTEQNIMVRQLDQPVNLTVRVDKDGDPMTKMK